MSLLEILLKLVLAVALGGLVGLERETSQKPAGFRTNILICVGATMMMPPCPAYHGNQPMRSVSAKNVASCQRLIQELICRPFVTS